MLKWRGIGDSEWRPHEDIVQLLNSILVTTSSTYPSITSTAATTSTLTSSIVLWISSN